MSHRPQWTFLQRIIMQILTYILKQINVSPRIVVWHCKHVYFCCTDQELEINMFTAWSPWIIHCFGGMVAGWTLAPPLWRQLSRSQAELGNVKMSTIKANNTECTNITNQSLWAQTNYANSPNRLPLIGQNFMYFTGNSTELCCLYLVGHSLTSCTFTESIVTLTLTCCYINNSSKIKTQHFLSRFVSKHQIMNQKCQKLHLKNRKSSIPWVSLPGLSETSPKWRMAAISSQRTASSLSLFFWAR